MTEALAGDILLHADTHARIADRLSALEGRVGVIVMDDEGTFRRPGEGGPVSGPAPRVVFGSIDAFNSPQIATFMGAILQTPELAWFQSAAAGIEHPIFKRIAEKAAVFTTCHVQAEAMAEWALWAALDTFRNGPAHRANQASAVWQKLPSREIAGSRWLIVGFGAIGEAVGRRVRALGGHVTGVRRSGGSAPDADQIRTAVTPADLAQADVVLLAVPHTPQTEGMANRVFFDGMKDGALFLNLGRGALVDEPALLAALDAGRPGFAGLDVFATEPLPADSPFWSHPKVLLTPHDSAHSPGTSTRGDALFLDNLERWLNGAPLRHVVDRTVFA